MYDASIITPYYNTGITPGFFLYLHLLHSFNSSQLDNDTGCELGSSGAGGITLPIVPSVIEQLRFSFESAYLGFR